MVVYSCLERALDGGCRFRPKFLTYGNSDSMLSMFLRLSGVFTFGDNCTSLDTSRSCSSVRLPHGGVVGF